MSVFVLGSWYDSMNPTRLIACTASDGGIEHQQEEHPHHRFRSLNDITDTLGLEWMDCPESGNSNGETGRRLEIGCGNQEQRAAQESIERQASHGVNEKVEEVITAHIDLMDRVVDRKGEVEQWTAMRQHFAQRCEITDAFVVDDVALIIQKEGAVETVGIDGRRRGYDE